MRRIDAQARDRLIFRPAGLSRRLNVIPSKYVSHSLRALPFLAQISATVTPTRSAGEGPC